jgi:hypothetical protein
MLEVVAATSNAFASTLSSTGLIAAATGGHGWRA